MKRKTAFAIALVIGLTASWGTAQAGAPAKNNSSCKEVWKKYPTGITANKAEADRAVASGWLRPEVNVRDY